MYPHFESHQAHLSWLPVSSDSPIPPHAIEAGSGIYVIRGRSGGDVIPGKWVRGHDSAYLPFGGEEVAVRSFEVLCNTNLNVNRRDYHWISSSGGSNHPKAVAAGMTEGGEVLFVARADINGELSVGKVHPSHNCAYFPWGGGEHKRSHYEILCFS
ncbi:unnamed protein product [Protopolystoma xenopodis]|uniref:Uncharacterized protein n=1 Tax=Protopolystoma xenopodis TaxID=117903 RepID=A0A448WG07_9PLAT|nr:unnamed protein product [Protopolystoma xenopodis]